VFDSIDGAIRCAVQVQQQMPLHDGDQRPDRAIRFRVGLNIGDAIADGTDLHGDAVNVAARLQAECPPGGICVSRAVRDLARYPNYHCPQISSGLIRPRAGRRGTRGTSKGNASLAACFYALGPQVSPLGSTSKL
jgi:class 3 adenylate cyclase